MGKKEETNLLAHNKIYFEHSLLFQVFWCFGGGGGTGQKNTRLGLTKSSTPFLFAKKKGPLKRLGATKSLIPFWFVKKNGPFKRLGATKSSIPFWLAKKKWSF